MKNLFRLSIVLVLFTAPLAAYAGGLTDFSGRPRTIADYTGHGKWLVVMFWAHDCKYCNRDVASKERMYRQYRNKNITVLGVSMDGQEHRQGAIDFIRRHKVTFPNLIGEPQDVVDSFMQYTGDNWAGTPTFLIFDPEGKVRAEQAGAIPNSLIENFIREHSQQVAPGPSKT
jgi:peroxiredoxin